MNQRRAGHGNRCGRCRVNNHFCVCEALKPFSIGTNVSLIVHVSELILTSNTAQFVQKMLPQNAEIYIRGSGREVFSPDPLLAREGRPLYLFPDENSVELNDEFLEKYPGPYHLIVPDGNWGQAKKVKVREKKFHDILSVRIPEGNVAEYKLRKAPKPNWVSTYEAVTHALRILEGEEAANKLMDFFRVWVEATLNARSGNFSLAYHLTHSDTEEE